MLRLLLIPALFTLTSTTSQNLRDDLLKETAAPTLRRVVVLARHGSKVPAPKWVLDCCPAFRKTQEEFLSKLQVTPNELTPAGQLELFSVGQFARQRYIDNLRVLPKSYYLNKTFSFQSQRSAFCLQSTAAFGMGMFPDGTGPPGFLESNPQIVPISVPYGLSGTDVLFNCRDGPCESEWKAGKAQHATPSRLAEFKEKHRETLEQISRACDAKPEWAARSDVLDITKDLDDAITWAKESGLSVDFYGRMSKQAATGFEQMAYDIVKDVYVGHGEQLAVTACGFPSKLLSLLSSPSKNVQFDFFLNHREMLYGTLAAFFFDTTFEIPDHFPGFMITGSTFFFELHEDTEGEYVKIYLYFPTGNGFVVQLLPKGCDASRCPLQTMKDNFAKFVDQNGDISQTCAKTGATSTIDFVESQASSIPVSIVFGLIVFIAGVVIGRMNVGTLGKRRDVINPMAPRNIKDGTAEKPLLQSAL